MKKLLVLFLVLIMLLSCGGLIDNKPNRIDHYDSKYIYVWVYNDSDSVLMKYSRPIEREFKVSGGHHTKAHHIKVDFNHNGVYECFSISSDIFVSESRRCGIVDTAQNAWNKNRYVIGIFKEEFYPHHDFHFIRYK